LEVTVVVCLAAYLVVAAVGSVVPVVYWGGCLVVAADKSANIYINRSVKGGLLFIIQHHKYLSSS
jgi:hypothetical protein